MGGQCAEPFLGGLGRLAIVTGMCQESLLGAPVPERPTPEIAGGSEGGRAMVERAEEGRGGSRSLGPEVGSSSAKIRGAGRERGQQRPPPPRSAVSRAVLLRARQRPGRAAGGYLTYGGSLGSLGGAGRRGRGGLGMGQRPGPGQEGRRGAEQAQSKRRARGRLWGPPGCP
jgi:hypothetical protein